MQIKGSETNKSKAKRPRRFLGALLAIALLALVFVFGLWTGKHTRVPEQIQETADRVEAVNPVTNPSGFSKYLSGVTSRPRQMIITMDTDALDHLAFKRNQALARGKLVTEEDSFVPAKISVDGKAHKVKIRLKGDVVDHLEGDKWSLRVQVRGDDAIWGMKRFSIQAPQRSGWIKEWILYQLQANEGLMALRYDFIDVVLNGKDLGIFALEESFSKELLENNKRREGPILKFDESREMDRDLVNQGDFLSQVDILYAADIISFQTGKTYRNPALKEQFLAGRALLNDFRSGKKTCSQVFDLEKAARVFAVSDIIASYHSLRWKNVRFYYNPVTARLELIPYNAYGPFLKELNPVVPVFGLTYFYWIFAPNDPFVVHQWVSRFFSDPAFRKAYFHELDRLCRPGYLEGFFEKIGPDLNGKLAAIYKDGPLDLATPEQYLKNRDLAYEALHPKVPVKAYLEKPVDGEGNFQLVVANTGFLPVELLGLECEKEGLVFDRFSTRIIGGKRPGQPLEYIPVAVNTQDARAAACLASMNRLDHRVVLENVNLQYRVPGLDTPRQARVDAHPIVLASNLVIAGPELESRLDRFVRLGLLKKDEAARTLFINPGKWKLESDLIVPPGWKLHAGPGTMLSLVNKAALISYGPVHFAGKPKNPVRIVSSDSTGQGLAVVSPGGPCVLEYVIVAGQGSVERGAWKLTGAVSFYDADVTINGCYFKKNRSEDLVNIIRGQYRIEESGFKGSFSDALDVDFSDGKIVNATFADCGNDCVDFSGSVSRLENVDVLGAGDKGVSVGERSRVSLEKCLVTEAKVGLASKDGSQVSCKDSTIKDSRVGLAAYRKKPEFDGGAIETENTRLENINQSFVLELGSSILHNGAMVNPELGNRKALGLLEKL